MDKRSNTITLQKTLKEGIRRCVYRRWEAEVKGKILITKTTSLERMYRGNSPYPTGLIKQTSQFFASSADALSALHRACERRRKIGYRAK
jgi:cytochrome c556